MHKKSLDHIVRQASHDLSYVIRTVGERGFSDSELEADEYDVLLMRKEFRDLVVGELYETYFLPERHEFDWQVLHEMVGILASEKVREFVAKAILGGVLGNAAFAALRAVLKRIISDMKNAGLPGARQEPFSTMKRDVDEIERFFREHERARISAVESFTKVSREKLYPLLKLLGFKHHRRTFNCYWCRPGVMIGGCVGRLNNSRTT